MSLSRLARNLARNSAYRLAYRVAYASMSTALELKMTAKKLNKFAGSILEEIVQKDDDLGLDLDQYTDDEINNELLNSKIDDEMEEEIKEEMEDEIYEDIQDLDAIFESEVYRESRVVPHDTIPGPKPIPVPMISLEQSVPVVTAEGISLDEFVTGVHSKVATTMVCTFLKSTNQDEKWKESLEIVAISATETYPDDPKTLANNDSSLQSFPPSFRARIGRQRYGSNIARPAMMFKDLLLCRNGQPDEEKSSLSVFTLAGMDENWKLLKNYRKRIVLPVPVRVEYGDKVTVQVLTVGTGRAVGTLTLWVRPAMELMGHDCPLPRP